MNEDLAEMLFDEKALMNNIKDMDETYSSTLFSKVHYTPTNNKPGICEIVDTSKYDMLVENIEKSNISQADKNFLKLAAARHIVFNYGKIADYYANSDAEVQRLMEESALIILDLNDAIAHGYVKCAGKINEIVEKDLAINLKLRAEKAERLAEKKK